MSMLDKIVDGYFWTSGDGRRIFYPRGGLGTGYAIDDDRLYARARREMKLVTLAMAVIIIVPLLAQRYVVALVLALVACVAYYGVLSHTWVVRGLTPTADAMPVRQAMIKQAMQFRPSTLIGLGGLCAALAAHEGYLVATGASAWWPGLGQAAVLAAVTVLFGFFAYLRRVGEKGSGSGS